MWDAIKRWVELPVTKFHNKHDTLPLAEKPPELAGGIEELLTRFYPSIYANLQKLRQEYSAWKNENVSAKFTNRVKEVATMSSDDVHDYNDSVRKRLLRLHSQIAEQIKHDILDKHHNRLKNS